MKFTTTLLVHAVLLSAVLGGAVGYHASLPTPFSESAFYRVHAKEVVVVSVEPNDQGWRGTGIILGPRTVITKLHITQGHSVVYLRTFEGERMHATVVQEDKRNDFVRLYPARPLHHFAHVSLRRPPLGGEVYLISNPLGLNWSYARGYVMYPALRTIQSDGWVKQQLIQVSIAASHGSSGGPLYDRAGNLVGMTDAMIDSHFLFFSPASQFCASILDCKEEL